MDATTANEDNTSKGNIRNQMTALYSAAERQLDKRLFETFLAAFCSILPAILLLSAGTADRGSISAYYDMDQNQIFYFGLTVAVMLFVVSWVMRSKNKPYVFLGIALGGVVLFNHDDFSVVHTVFAWSFFLGGLIVIGGVARGSWANTARPWLIAVTVAALAGHFIFGVPNFFVAEWAAMVAIAVHFVLHAWAPDTAYKAADKWSKQPSKQS